MATWRQDARAAGWGPKPAKRPRRQVEDEDYAAMVLRLVKRLGERAAEDPAVLGMLTQVQDAVRVALTVGVHGARSGEAQASWSDIGRELGISKQSAQERFGK